MLQNSFKKKQVLSGVFASRALRTAVYMVWVFSAFMLASLFVQAIVELLVSIGIPLASVNQSVLVTGISGIVYSIAIVVTIGVPYLVKKERTTRAQLGISKKPRLLDGIIGPLGFFSYILITAVFAYIAIMLLPFYDSTQAQDVGFTGLSASYEYILAFLTLVVVAPVAEELLFRGYLYGKLRQWLPTWLVIILTAGLFGLAHGAWNVGIDTFALGLVLASLRAYTGNIWSSILVHMIKNGLAYYLLFINPSFLTTIGG